MKLKLLLPGIVAAAAMSGAVSAAPCTTASYSTYLVSGFSCTVSDQTYSSFSFSSASANATAPTSGDITVAPDMTLNGPGLIFSSSAISVSQSTPIGSDTFIDVGLGFTVMSGTALLDDASLDVAGGASGSGTATVNETVSTVPPAPIPPLHVGFGGAPPPPQGIIIDFGPVPVVDISKDIFVDVPADTTGSADITTITQDFSQTAVPEPASLILLGTALAALGLLRWRGKESDNPAS